jgi:ATP-dependent helicase HrpB
LCEKVKKDGIEVLPLEKITLDFIKRVQFYLKNESAEILGQTNLSEKYENLSKNVEEWLSPFVISNQKVTDSLVYNALYYYLDGDRINKKVPREIVLKNGKKRKIVYENQGDEIIPVLEIIIQQLFGCFETPKIMGTPVLLKMLSPARRPLQITTDLSNFWKNTWPDICSEMKGRYPKHCWDYKRVVEDSFKSQLDFIK